MSQKHINTFAEGLDRDSSVNKFDNQHYFEAVNMRIQTENSLSNGALSLINGTALKAKFSQFDTILGTTTIRNKVIIFVYHPDGDKIYTYQDDGSINEQYPTLLYSGDLGFRENYPIRAIGNYETPSIQKIYFTDGDSFFRHLNVADPNVSNISIDEMEIVSTVEFKPINLAINTGGELHAGRIAYSYQFYNKNGAETMFSPTSKIISLVEDKEGIDTLEYLGSEKGVTVNKNISLTIANDSTIFNRIRIVAIEYQVYGQVPNYRIVGEFEVKDNSQIVITDSGQSIGTYTQAEFTFIQNDFVPKTLEIKDNLLIAANLKYKYFELPDTYDCRVFRWNRSLKLPTFSYVYSCTVYEGSNPRPIPLDLSDLPNKNHDCFNPYNNLDNDNDYTFSYKYNPDTGQLGGKGKYISYKFTTKRVVLDDNYKVYDYKGGFPRTLNKVSSDIQNYANPLQDVGYQRDEIYRFAIVFYDKQGRASYANWIGDIRFPNQYEYPFSVYDVDDGKTYANILGIQFNVDTTPIDHLISGYQIVRAERTSENSTIIDQGAISYVFKGVPISSAYNQYFSASGTPYAYECYKEKLYTRIGEYINKYSDGNSPAQVTFENPSAYFVYDQPQANPLYVEFMSPKIVFNKSNIDINSAYLEVIGSYNNLQNSYLLDEGKYSNFTEKYKGFYGVASRFKQAIKSSRIFTPIDPANTGDNYENDASLYTLNNDIVYNNQCNNFLASGGDAHPHEGLRGTFLMCMLNNKLAIPNNNDSLIGSQTEHRLLTANIRINQSIGIYGGISYEARANTTYIKASSLFTEGNTDITVYGGDTYINNFTYLRSLYKKETHKHARQNQSLLIFPCESRYNLQLRLDDIQKYHNWGADDDDINGVISANYGLRETVSDGVQAFGTYYPTEVGDLYRYNTAYSAEDKSFFYYPKPFDFEAVNEIDTRITVSEKKIVNEYSDSWLQWKFNNFIDVDSRYHEIVRLINVNNTVYFGQPKAIGRIAINDRSLIQEGNAQQLALGTGGVLERVDYLTTNSGISTYDAITSSDKTFYYVDAIRKRMYGMFDGDQPISLLKGLNSYLAKLNYNTVELEFDPQYNEVLVNIDGTVICYNELINAFTSFYSYNPDRFFRIGKYLYIVKGQNEASSNFLLLNETDYALIDDNPISRVLLSDLTNPVPSLYRLNAGEPGAFYSEADAEPLNCSVTLVVNPNGTMINAFDSIDIRTDVRDSDDNWIPFETFNTLFASNNTQTINKSLVYSTTPGIKGTIEKIANIWRTQLIESKAYNAGFKRMVDTFMILKLTYNSSGKSFKVHDIATAYRPLNR